MKRESIIYTVVMAALLITGCTDVDSSPDETYTSAEAQESVTKIAEETTEETAEAATEEAESSLSVQIDGRTYLYSPGTTSTGTGYNCDGSKYCYYSEDITLTPLEDDFEVNIDNECLRFIFDNTADIASASSCGYVFETLTNGNTLTFSASVTYGENASKDEETNARNGLCKFLQEHLIGFGAGTGYGTEDVIISTYLCNVT